MPGANVSWPVPLVRLNPWYPGQMGVPGTDSETGLRTHGTGTIFYVDPNATGVSDGRDGTDPVEPLATVAAALTHCQAYRGDVIAVMTNSYWTYGTTAVGYATPIREAVIVSVPGVRIVGVAPSGSLGVPWVPTANNATCITVNAMDVLVEGFAFWEDGGYTGTTGILAQWDGPPWGESVVIRNNYFYDLAYGVQLDYSWNACIEGNRFDDLSTAAIHNPSVYGEPDYCTIRSNVFINNVADINLPGCDNQLIEANRFLDVTAAIVLLNGDLNTIHGNTIQGVPGGTNNYINLTGGANNLVSNNWLACTIAQYDTTCSDATSGSWVHNMCTNGPTTAPPT